MAALSKLKKHSRPREKLLSVGANNLTDYELLALLLGSGTQKQNVVALANSILKQYPLKKLSKLRTTDLLRLHGVGPARAAIIQAAIELSHRLQMLLPRSSPLPRILSTQDALSYLKPLFSPAREQIVALYLDARHQLLSKEVLALGHLNSVSLEPRDVYGPALRLPATSVIIAHNHPSGDPEPSQDDLQVTEILEAAAELLGVQLLDHLIWGGEKYYSFSENGLLT